VLTRMSIAQYLRDCGYKVIEAVTAADVWTVIDSGTALDVVFSEVNLPGPMDGFALARRLRQTPSQIAVILSSGVAGAADKSQALCEEGPVKKPYQAADIAAQIRQLLERRRASGPKR
jgi:CheY-like chemotaxis protein